MTCNACGEKPKNTAKDFTKAVIEINNPETLVLLRKVVIPASMGTEEQVPAAIGKYHNVILHYEANKHTYLYSSDGIPTLLETDVSQEVLDKIGDLSTLLTTDKTSVVAAINELAGEIEEGGNNIVELTMEHYNFPVDNPQGIAVWLLDPNYIYINKTEDLSFVLDGTDIGYAHELEGIFLVTPTQDYQNRCSVIYFSCDGEQSLGTEGGVGTYTTYNKVTGELVDSGVFLTEKQIEQTTGANDNRLMSQKAITDALNTKAGRNELPTKVSDLTNDSNFQTGAQVSSAIATAVGQITEFSFEVVQTLPATGDTSTIYLVPITGSAQNTYDEYLYVSNAWEKIGSTDIDLSNYVQSTDLATVATTGDYNDLANLPGDMVVLEYGTSTWADFLAAYNDNRVVYCRASSNSDPASGAQTRMAFMAYVNNPTSPTEVEFQYVRSVSTKTAAQQMDQVFVYKLTSASGGTWTVATRDMASEIVAGTNMTSSYSNGTLTLNATQPTVNDSTVTVTNNGTSKGSFTTNQSAAETIALDYPEITMQTTDPGEGVALAANHFIGVYE